MRRLIAFAVCGLALAGCNANILGPNDRNLLGTPSSPTYSGGTPPVLYLFQDAFNMNAWFQGLAVWDNYNYVVVDSASATQPFAGTRCLKVTFDTAHSGTYTGGATWAELAFIHTPDYSGFAGTPGRDLSAGGYRLCRFMLRTSVASTVPFQMEGVGAVNVASTTAWQAVSIALPAPASQTAVKTFFQINTPTVMPVDIYIDDLRYEP